MQFPQPLSRDVDPRGSGPSHGNLVQLCPPWLRLREAFKWLNNSYEANEGDRRVADQENGCHVNFIRSGIHQILQVLAGPCRSWPAVRLPDHELGTFETS